MDFALLPPEINSGRMYSGPGSGPMLAAAAGWDRLATELQSAAASYESVISGLTAGPWLGPTSAAMAAAAGSLRGVDEIDRHPGRADRHPGQGGGGRL